MVILGILKGQFRVKEEFLCNFKIIFDVFDPKIPLEAKLHLISFIFSFLRSFLGNLRGQIKVKGE